MKQTFTRSCRISCARTRPSQSYRSTLLVQDPRLSVGAATSQQLTKSPSFACALTTRLTEIDRAPTKTHLHLPSWGDEVTQLQFIEKVVDIAVVVLLSRLSAYPSPTLLQELTHVVKLCAHSSSSCLCSRSWKSSGVNVAKLVPPERGQSCTADSSSVHRCHGIWQRSSIGHFVLMMFLARRTCLRLSFVGLGVLLLHPAF